MKNINAKFEELIDRISIKDGKKKYIKGQVKYLTRHLKAISKELPINYFSSDYFYSDFEITQFNYGGSFDRHICVKNRYDIDLYIIYSKKPTSWYSRINNYFISGNQLFQILRYNLDSLCYNYQVNLSILKNFPYEHAIPICIDFKSQKLYIDCIPALIYQNDYIIVPNGISTCKLVNPNLELQGLGKVNKMQNGNATKLIILLKYWNIYWNRPLKSYIIERLVEEIFSKCNIHGWNNGLKTFFNRAINIFKSNIFIPDRIYESKSIFVDYTDKELQSFYEVLKDANCFAQEDNWTELFGLF